MVLLCIIYCKLKRHMPEWLQLCNGYNSSSRKNNHLWASVQCFCKSVNGEDKSQLKNDCQLDEKGTGRY